MAPRSYDSASSVVRRNISESARLTGMSEELLVRIIGRESGFDPNAANRHSSARGLGQFLDATWNDTTARHGGKYGITSETSRLDPRASALMTAEHAKDNAASLRKSLGRAADPGEIYAAHFLGAGGAAAMIKAATRTPGASAADLFAEAAASNKSIFFDQKGGKRRMDAVLRDLTSTADGVTGGGAGALLPTSGAMPNIYVQEPPPEPEKGFWGSALDGYKMAAEQEQSQVMIAQYLMRAGDASLAPDASFKWTDESIKARTADLPEEMAEWVVENAHSEGHADHLVKRAKRELENEAGLAEYGMLGNLGLHAAAVVTDLPTWAIGFGAGKLTGGARLAKLAMAGRAGLIAAAENAPLEAIKMGSRANYGLDDAMINTATAMAFGAGFGAILGKPGEKLDDAFKKEAHEVDRHMLQKNGTLTAAGEEYFRTNGLSPLDRADVKVKGAVSGGAAAADAMPVTWVDKLRFSTMGRLMKSKSSVVRDMANKLENDVVGDGGMSLRGDETALEEVTRISQIDEYNLQTTVTQAWADYTKRNGIRGKQKIGAQRLAFNEEIGRQIIDQDHTLDPAIIKAADAHRAHFAKKLDEAKASGAEWAQDVKPDRNYLPMIFEKERFRKAVEMFDDTGVISVIRQAFASSNPTMGADLLDKVSASYFRTVQHSVEGWAGARVNALQGLDLDELSDLLVANGLERVDADDFIAAQKVGRASGPKNFRRRALLNDKSRFKPEGGKPGQELSIRDLTDMDAERVGLMYGRSITGHVAMQKRGFKSYSDFETQVEGITLKAANGLDGMTTAEAKAEQSALQYLGKNIYGIPVINMADNSPLGGPKLARFASILGNFNFTTLMGQSGIAQFGDIPKILHHTSIEAAWRTFRFDDLVDVLRRGGSEADDLTRGLISMTGVGTNGSRKRIFEAFQDMESVYLEDGAELAMKQAQALGRAGANITAMVSGMTPVTDFLSRWAVRAHAQHLVDISTGRKVLPKTVMNDLGLSEADVARFSAMLKKAKVGPDGTLMNLNTEALRAADATGFDKMSAYLSRRARTTVLETSPGMLPEVMGMPAVRLLLQFRSYSMASHEANTLHNIKMGTMYAGTSYAMTGAWASAVFALHTYTKSLGRPEEERQEFLKKNLNLGAITANGFFSRSADAGVLPIAVGSVLDIALRPFDIENPLNQGRTTGLKAGVEGVPTISALYNLGAGVDEALKDTFTESRMTRKDVKRWARLLPLNNTYGVANAIHALAGQFPEDDKK